MVKKQTDQPQIRKSSLAFLETLAENNHRDWFNAHKSIYLEELQHIETFANALLEKLSHHDLIETPSGKKSLHRIYRDVRFSGDKRPYKNNWSGAFKRATKFRRGGYYFHIEPGGSLIAGGFWGPVPEDLKRVRDDIAFDPTPLRKILRSKTFKNVFGAMEGEQLKTAPKGFDAGHEAADLLRYKQYLLIRRFTDKEVLSPGFLAEADRTFQAMRPFFDYMSEVLTTDTNGLAE